uniref:PBt10-like protein n=1 Tax=Bacillus thuringiensis subsp. galleriae TaxID=29338 RepID=Q6QAP1_BACTG|nr:pBt10-like protein [Bacillus thuringiensis serovar galleriae]
MLLKQFKEMLDQGAIPIDLIDPFGIPLRQFDKVQYKEEFYLIIWHPIYKEFVGSHESGDWIPYTDLHQSVWITNLKEHFASND